MLRAETACTYLRSAGRLPANSSCTAVVLGGGVSNEVVLVTHDLGRWVLKQALPRLRVAEEWLADAGRSDVEGRCLQLLGGLLPEGAVPRFVFSDAAAHVFAMTAAPPDAVNLKEELLAGRVDPRAAATAGDLLGRTQAVTRGRADVADAFANKEPFRQLRIDPYYGAVARRHPDLADPILGAARAMLEGRECLVHGDYSPKNMLARDGSLTLLDFEVAHWGARAFDPAFFLNHLVLKSLHLPTHARALAEAARAFWSKLLAAAAWPDPEALEAEVLGQLGSLLLARVDGKSPVEYLRAERVKQSVRDLAGAVLGGRMGTIGAVFQAVATE